MWLPGTKHILIFLLSVVVLSIIYFQFRVQRIIWKSEASAPSVPLFLEGRRANHRRPHKTSTNELARLNSKTSNQKRELKRTTAFIVTQMTSGSSLVGELFNEHPRCFYFFEPLHAVRYFQDHAHDSEAMQLRMLDGISRCDFGGLNKFLSFYLDTKASHFGGMRKSKTLQKLCRQYGTVMGRVCPIPRNNIVERVGGVCRSANFTVVKTIRVSDIKMFRAIAESREKTGNDVKIIHLVMDPRAIIASNLAPQYKNATPFSANQINATKVKNLCTWMKRNVQIKDKAKDWLHGRYTLVRFEDVAKAPIRLFKKLYGFLGIPTHKAVYSWLNTNTNVTKQGKYSDSRRGNLKETSKLWRSRLTLSAVEHIQETCGEVMSLLGYKIVKDTGELNNHSISLLGNLSSSVIHTV